MLPTAEAELLARGTVIPAHPLALTADRKLDERRQRALTRYYVAAGAGGCAVAVHTTQFEIRQPEVGLLRPVLELAADTLDGELGGRPFLRIAGACGPTAQAVAEAELAAELGYHAILLSPGGLPDVSEEELLRRARAVGEVLPVIGFYLQEAVGGRRLSVDFWRRLAELPSVVAIKLAPFDRYRTMDVVRGVAASGRAEEIALYTGNDDAILADLLGAGGGRIVGGLLGQWAVWTRSAVDTLRLAQRAVGGDGAALRLAVNRAPELTDANAAVFDVAHGFRGCIAGVHEVLRAQGLLAGTWCLDPTEGLSPGQAAEIARVRAAYPWLPDDEFVAEHRDAWLR
ncbi:dihydrodipicolinate synthase/N-acetylneuraminate lyase [Tamaricihabitans halophyticus]|uniref:Dihydrodipicolinate synthase/N-acetylneuraminate lyase n=1 Tax=Tamaricihabitans halophyticus TaxID=1262583 RepID=A0A4V2SUB3_9PSEU|nr:dihydrodipicolinate synthase family protein [Tamaricihabitans halophyticus]TCP53996.1 dihydrodipicolinate synthase/N-acetylneuraminate lyase [Tamaricihabitans halophyticus]